MKIFTHILIILLHLLSTVGYSMNIHNCAGHKDYTFYGIHFGHTCTCDHTYSIHKHKCCKDKNIVLKAEVKDKIVKRDLAFKTSLNAFYLPKLFSCYQPKTTASVTSNYLQNEFPPSHSPPLFILFGVFRI